MREDGDAGPAAVAAAIMVLRSRRCRPHPGGEDEHAPPRCGVGRGAGGAAAKRTNAIASGTTDTDNTYFENGFTERSELLRKEGRKEEEG